MSMPDPRGAVKVGARGSEYTLWLGMSVLAELQGKHGNEFLGKLDAPADAGPQWLPPLQIVVDLFVASLQRYHAVEADRYLVDEILAENSDVLQRLLAAAFPDQESSEGNGRGPGQAA